MTGTYQLPTEQAARIDELVQRLEQMNARIATLEGFQARLLAALSRCTSTPPTPSPHDPGLDVIETPTIRCLRCGQDKAPTGFPFDYRTPDTRIDLCRACGGRDLCMQCGQSTKGWSTRLCAKCRWGKGPKPSTVQVAGAVALVGSR